MAPIPCQDAILREYRVICDDRIPLIANEDHVLELSEVDQTICLVLYFDGEVLNGGLEQWILNPSGKYTDETLAALERIGAKESAALVRAVNQMFPNRRPSPDQMEREIEYDALTDEQRAKIDELSDVYGCEQGREKGRIFEMLYKYMINNRKGDAEQ